MEFKKIEVQALDSSLGRWEPAKVLEQFEDGSVKVSFIGWGKEYNTIVRRGEVRAAVHPFHHEIGKNIILCWYLCHYRVFVLPFFSSRICNLVQCKTIHHAMDFEALYLYR